jgi:tetratricopeptide (TPR) repeat protein
MADSNGLEQHRHSAWHKVADGANALEMTTAATTLKHNPGLISDDVLEATFAARELLLASLIERVRQNAGRENVQHYLLIGPRGSGKTTLLRLLALRVQRDPALSKEWLPVPFAEEEFSIYDLKDFFLTVLERMQATAPDADALRAQLSALGASNPDAALDKAVQAVRDAAASQQRRLLLLVDNLDQILEQVAGSDDLATRRLRSVLQHDSLFMLVGTSVAIFDELVNYQRPLYQFFAPILLPPLDESEVMEVLRRRAMVDRRNLAADFPRDLKRKVRVITAIAGGNPRLVVALYDVLCGRPLLDILDTFARLMDELTPYYKGRLETLAPQQRKLIDALTRAGGGATPAELAALLGVKPNQVSSQLLRLRESGWLRTRRAKDRRSTQYVIVDQLFRTWYQMRYLADRRHRYAFLVGFYQSFYSAGELMRLHHRLLTEYEGVAKPITERFHLEPRDQLGHELEELGARLVTVLEALPAASDRDSKRWYQARLFVDAGQTESAKALLESSLAEHRADCDRSAEAVDELYFAFIDESHNQYDAALRHYRDALSLSPNDPHILVHYATALLHLGQLAEAEAIYRRVIEQQPANLFALHRLGGLLETRGSMGEAEQIYQRVLEDQPTDVPFICSYGSLLIHTGRENEAEALYRKGLATNASNVYLLCHLAECVARLGRLSESEGIYRCALELDQDNAYVMHHLAVFLQNVDRGEEAIVLHRETIRRDRIHVCAIYNLAVTLAHLGRTHEAMECYRQATVVAAEIGFPHESEIRADYALFLSDCLVETVGTDSFVNRNATIEQMLDAIEPLEDEERRVLWFRFLLNGLERNVESEIFDEMVRRIGQRFPEAVEALNVFQIAQEARLTGDQSVLMSLDEEVRAAVERVLSGAQVPSALEGKVLTETDRAAHYDIKPN